MKSFRFRFTTLTWVLISIVILISVGGLAWNIHNLIQVIPFGTKRIVFNAIIVAFNAFLVVLSISVGTNSKYVIKNGKIYTRFGIIFTKTELSEIVQFTHFKKSDKLVMYYKSAEYSVIVISPEQYQDFIVFAREINPQIIYNAQIDGEDTPN